MKNKGFYQFEIIIIVVVSSFWFIWISYGSTKYFDYFSAETTINVRMAVPPLRGVTYRFPTKLEKSRCRSCCCWVKLEAGLSREWWGSRSRSSSTSCAKRRRTSAEGISRRGLTCRCSSKDCAGCTARRSCSKTTSTTKSWCCATGLAGRGSATKRGCRGRRLAWCVEHRRWVGRTKVDWWCLCRSTK